MKRTLPWVLLAISLLVNLGFLFGVMQAQQRAERLALAPDARAEAVVERLALRPDQQTKLEELRAAVQERREASDTGDERTGRQHRFLEELAKPAYDQAAVEALLRDQMDERIRRWARNGADLHDFLGELDEEQRQSFFSLAEEDRSFLRALLFPQWNTRSD